MTATEEVAIAYGILSQHAKLSFMFVGVFIENMYRGRKLEEGVTKSF
jgi:hypothetical protein